MDYIKKTKRIVDKYNNDKEAVLDILQDVQEEFGYVPKESVAYIASACSVNLSRLFGILTFYSQFYLSPRGKNILKVCCGTACHVKGAERNLAKAEEVLNIKDGQTSADRMYTLEKIACMGACGLAPVVTINKDVYGHVTPERIDKIIKNKGYRE
ncbi:MAG: NADH-quinone oxidoreductase subunit NuoE [Candidatus Omnitrophota bacterium]|nr:NADH-quinone oxidoreductase subunit NuoE [Candidatus Omnitrophota bacterium]